MTVRYKLTMIEETIVTYPASGIKPLSLKRGKEIRTIGRFDSEEELKRWAERNDGQLIKEKEEV